MLQDFIAGSGAKLPDLQSGIWQTDTPLEKMKADVHDIVEWKDHVAKDLDELMDWKSTFSGKLDDLVRENAAMRSMQETLQNKELTVLSIISLFFRVLFLFAGKEETEERVSRRTGKAWMPALASSSFTTLVVQPYN